MRASGNRWGRVRLVAVIASISLGLPVLNSGTVAVADATTSVDDRSVAVPTAWKVYTGLTPAQVSSTVLTPGYRLTEIHADQPTNPTTYTVRAVNNAGAYAVSGWWWYYGKTTAQINSLLGSNNARLISLDGYNTSAGARYAVVMVSNAGPAAKSWHWWVSTTTSFITSHLNSDVDRIIDLGEFAIGSTRYFTAVTIHNTTPDNKGWYWYTNRTTAQVQSLLSTNHARIVDIEAVGNGNWDVVMQTDGIGFNLWYVGRPSAAALLAIANQTGTRLTAIQRYASGSSTLYAGIFVNNLTTQSATMRDLQWGSLGSFNKWGFYSKQVGGPVLTSLQSSVQFEPASAIKVVSHLYLHMRMQNNSVNMASAINYPYRASDPNNKDICPATGDPLHTTTVENADNKMMTVSDNRMTRAIKDAYGYSNILAVANILGMSRTSFPNTLGCLTYGTYNLTTLADLGRLYESVAAGTSIAGAARTHFYANMLNFNNYSPAKTAFCNVATAEGNDLGKSGGTITAFCNAMEWAAKGGSYTLTLSGVRHIWRSNASRLALPFKSPPTSGPITLQEYVYGDYVHDVIATVAQENSINNGRTLAAAEQFRAQIRAAMATW
ncbi:MAG: hypothetical protein QOE45_2364 [Frankiaceae bacterium]|jgi:hypothetical protein|nr:hypothetical protein [Frankiaceae bacterium]